MPAHRLWTSHRYFDCWQDGDRVHRVLCRSFSAHGKWLGVCTMSGCRRTNPGPGGNFPTSVYSLVTLFRGRAIQKEKERRRGGEGESEIREQGRGEGEK